MNAQAGYRGCHENGGQAKKSKGRFHTRRLSSSDTGSGRDSGRKEKKKEGQTQQTEAYAPVSKSPEENNPSSKGAENQQPERKKARNHHLNDHPL